MRRVLLCVSVLALMAGAAAPVSAAGGTAVKPMFDKGGLFIVQMREQPVVAYDGSIAGYRATKPAPGAKIDPLSADVTRYASLLKSRHAGALKRAGATKKLYDYVYSYNGFLAKLSATQANRLAADDAVLAVERNERVEMDTSSTPAFLGLDAPGGLWQQLGGTSGNKNAISGAGDGVVIGIVDSGIWPESRSFTDRDSTGKLLYSQLSPGSFHGKCDSAEKVIDAQWDANKCNKKLVAARHFNAAWGGDAALEAARPWEFQSPRDYNGHGTHTASTAGGNHGVAATGPAAVFGSVSGMAPRARIAAYKALWSTESGDTASGQTGDLVAAIDQAVADGVDVINYSISGSRTEFANSVMVSFLFAADAGVFVAASAGNSGPAVATVAHPGPWVTTVAAGTHNRDGRGSVTLGNAVTYNGASVATAVGPAPLIDSTAAGLPGADPTRVELCYAAQDNVVGTPATATPVLDPAKVAGKIVVCKRGVTARVNKSLAVQQAGGVGMILYNDPDSSLNADFHFVPTVHVNKADGLAVKAYAASAGASATATINQATIIFNAPAPFTASFSSRGPLVAGGGDVLKPDVIAPGQDILAAVAPTPASAGREFNLLSGTSMSSPHVAGLAALLMDKHPSWSPMAVKSALMTSANDVLDGPNTNPLVIFRQGAGHVRPNSAADPGLVYDSGFIDWLAFLCGTTNAVSPAFCATLSAEDKDPSNMNVASIAIGDLAGSQTVTRRVTNVGPAATYTPTVTGMSGVNVSISPTSLNMAAGQTREFQVTFTRTTAALDAYVGGQLTWSAGTRSVRSPLVVKPVALAAPALIESTATADSGTVDWTVQVGYNGTLDADGLGLAPDVQTLDEFVAQDPDADPTTDPFDAAKGVNVYDFALAGTEHYWAGGVIESTDDVGDLDVYLLRDNANGTAGFQFPADLVAQAADGDSDEVIQIVRPTAGNYRLMVHGWGTPGDAGATYDLHTWTVTGSADGGTLTAAPAGGDGVAVTIGQRVDINAAFSGATAGQWRGIVDYFNGTPTRIGTTVVIIHR